MNVLPAILLSCLGYLGFANLAHASTLDDIQKRGELRIAVQTQGPPFSMIDKNGARTGSSVELAKLMAQEMGVKVVFLDLDWDGLLPALISGKADLLAADMTPTLARATKVAFTKPFMYVGPVARPKKEPSSIPQTPVKRRVQGSRFYSVVPARSWQRQFLQRVKSRATKVGEHYCWTR